jgi:hypothetical protein
MVLNKKNWKALEIVNKFKDISKIFHEIQRHNIVNSKLVYLSQLIPGLWIKDASRLEKIVQKPPKVHNYIPPNFQPNINSKLREIR